MEAIECRNEPEPAGGGELRLTRYLTQLNDRRDKHGLAEPRADFGEEHQSDIGKPGRAF
jgi:hypothetical protein